MKKKILIVEDEIIIAFFIKKTVEQLGYEVVAVANNGEAALATIKTITPDLILMEIMISGNLDGIETMESIKKIADIPVIYITGNSNPSIRKRAEKTGMAGFYIKPIEDYDIEHILENFFTQKLNN